jgi:hypothetical protein
MINRLRPAKINLERFFVVSAITVIVKNYIPLLLQGFLCHETLNLEVLANKTGQTNLIFE